MNEPLNDGSMIEVNDDDTWDLCLPNGRHVRGKAKTLAEAKAAAHAAHDAFVLTQWKKGSPIAGSRFVVPLS